MEVVARIQLPGFGHVAQSRAWMQYVGVIQILYNVSAVSWFVAFTMPALDFDPGVVSDCGYARCRAW